MADIEKTDIEKYNDALYEAYKSGKITMDEWQDNIKIDETHLYDDIDQWMSMDVEDLFKNDPVSLEPETEPQVEDDLFSEFPEFADLFKDPIDPEPEQEEEKINFPTTQTIKGNIINLNYVESIEKIDKEHNNNITYGVKFNFTGKKKFYRIVWFNTNITQRDIVYEKQTKYLNQLKNTIR